MGAGSASSSAPGPAALGPRALAALVEASRAITGDLELRRVVQSITEQAMAVLEAEAASLLRYERDRGELIFEATTGPAATLLLHRRMPADAGIAGQALRTGRAVRIDDVRQNRNFFGEIDDATAMKTRNLAAAPLVHGDEALGVIEVINASGRDGFSDDDLRLLEVFANLAAAAMRAASRFDRVVRENEARRGAESAPEIVGEAPAFRVAIDLCRRVARADTSVLITGETGTGKEVAARLIHTESKRRAAPFIAVNCAAVSESLLESELFGHEKGAFTGAEQLRRGWFELADGGTLFLDEVGEMAPPTQAKLLRVLQERCFTRVGGSEPISCDVRIIAATNRDLDKAVRSGDFRDDLLYRLNVFPIRMPALRERVADIGRLFDHFLHELSPTLGLPKPEVDGETIDRLERYGWPGNVRELRNIAERCTLLCDGRIEVDHLPQEIREPVAGGMQRGNGGGSLDATAPSALEAQEVALIRNALDAADWNQSEAARSLGISRDVLRYRMRKHDLRRK